MTNNTSNESLIFCLSNDVKHITYEYYNKRKFFHFYFLNIDISLNIRPTCTIFEVYIESIRIQESVSHIFCLGPTFDFMTKKRETFVIFFKIPSSTSDKIKTKTCIKILRHASLHTDLSNMYISFQAVK